MDKRILEDVERRREGGGEEDERGRRGKEDVN